MIKTTCVCDRCDQEEASCQNTDASQYPFPFGWKTISIKGESDRHICNNCYQEYREYLYRKVTA